MSNEDPFSGVVTARDIYGAVQELRGEVHSTSAELRSAQADIQDLKESQQEHEGRLQTLERWRAGWGPVAAGSGGLAALAAAVVQYLS